MVSRRDAVAALASTVVLPLIAACGGDRTVKRSGSNDADAGALLDRLADDLLRLIPGKRDLAGHRHRRESGASIPAGRSIGRRAAAAGAAGPGRPRARQRLRHQPASRMRRAPASTSCEVPTRTALEGFALPYGDITVGGWRNTPYVVIQNVGAYLDIPRFLDSDHPIENAADAEAYLARLQSYAKQLDGELGRMQAARGAGLVPPAFLIDKALAQMTLSAAQNAREGGTLVESIERRTKKHSRELGRARSSDREAGDRARARAAARGARGRSVPSRPTIPASRPARTARSSTAGRSRHPPRRACRPTKSTRWAEASWSDLHARDGRDPQAGRLLATAPSATRMRALAKDPRYKFSEGDKGRAEIMAFINDRLDWIRAQMPRAFNMLVKPNMEVKRLPPEEEPGAPGAYGGAGSIDGKIPGRFWINLRTTDLHSKYSLADLTFHEAIPGHIWQGEYTHQMPLIRQLLAFNAYSEGWALYAEQLADELGAYDNDPVGRLGYLQSTRVPGLPAGGRHRHPREALDAANRACASSST